MTAATGIPTICVHPRAARPCEPGILARCRVCRLFSAPCTQTGTRFDVKAILDRSWICNDCRAEAAS